MAESEKEELIRLATECIEWHAENCRTCLTGVTCVGAAENIAVLEGFGISADVNGNTETATEQWKPEGVRRGTQHGATQRTTRRASEKQIAFLSKLFQDRNVHEATELQSSVLHHTWDALKKQNWCTAQQAHDAIEILTQLGPKQFTSPPNRSSGPTEKQVQFFSKLLDERETEHTLEEFTGLSRAQASRFVDDLLKAQKKETKTQTGELSAGIYAVADRVYKVYKAVRGSGRMVAKVLTVHDHGEASFSYVGLAERFIPAGTDPMSLAQAKEFGVLYGVCCVCGRTLTKEESIKAGIGPICAGKLA